MYLHTYIVIAVYVCVYICASICVYDNAYTNATGADFIYMSRPLHVCAIYKLSVESKGGSYMRRRSFMRATYIYTVTHTYTD